MILLVAIGCFILAALIGGGKKTDYWTERGFKTESELWEAKKKFPSCDDGKHQYYLQKAWQEWENPEWTEPEKVIFMKKNYNSILKVSWINEIAQKMEYNAGYEPCDFKYDLDVFDPNNYHKSWNENTQYRFKVWQEEGICI